MYKIVNNGNRTTYGNIFSQPEIQENHLKFWDK